MNSTLHRVAVDRADASENSGTLFSDEAVSEESSALHWPPELKLAKNRLHHRAHRDS